MTSSNRTRTPDPADRALVAYLVDEHGILGASKRLGLSRLALYNVMSGGGCYAPTLARIRAARAAVA